MKMIDVYMRQVEIIKQINTRIIIHFKRRHYSDNICEYSRHLNVIKDDMVRKDFPKENVFASQNLCGP